MRRAQVDDVAPPEHHATTARRPRPDLSAPASMQARAEFHFVGWRSGMLGLLHAGLCQPGNARNRPESPYSGHAVGNATIEIG